MTKKDKQKHRNVDNGNCNLTAEKKEEKNDGRKKKQTSMCRSVAPVNESITRDSTVNNGRCFGKDAPGAGV